MIHQATEGQTTWLPGVSQTDFPPNWPPSIDIRLRPTGVGVLPQGVVGNVPLLNGDSILIQPKIGRVNFLHLFFRAGGTQQELEREFEEFVTYSLEAESNMITLAARQLYVTALGILRFGPKIGRVSRRHLGAFATGRIDAVATSLRVLSRRRQPVAFWVRERTLDIPENRVLTEALVCALPLLSNPDRKDFAFIYDKWLSRFPRSQNLLADLEHISHGFAQMSYGGARDYYRRALMLAKVVLGNSGLGFVENAAIEGDAILLNTADVFERFLRRVVAERHAGVGFVVSKGGDRTTSLYTDGSYRMVPDIVVTRNRTVRFIADAKYKEPSSSDHYQMHAYLHAMGAEVGLLLSPTIESNDIISKKYQAADGKVVWEIYLPMSNLSATEVYLGELAQRFGH